MELKRFATEVEVKLDLHESAHFLEFLAGLAPFDAAALPLRVTGILPGENRKDGTMPAFLEFRLTIDSGEVPLEPFRNSYRELLSAIGLL